MINWDGWKILAENCMKMEEFGIFFGITNFFSQNL